MPTFIIEILSPSNQSNDLVVKLNLYMKYGVKEYWIINPMINTVQTYSLNNDGLYDQIDVVKNSGTISSKIFNGFTVDIGELFKE
nr:Uma2 family endonuclease [Clostridium magnum]